MNTNSTHSNLSHLQLLKHLKVKCNIPSTHCILSQLNLKPRKNLHLEPRYSTPYPHSLSTLSHQSSPLLKHLMCLSTQIHFTLNLGPKDLLKNQCHLHSIPLIKFHVTKCRNLFTHCILKHLNLKPPKILHLATFQLQGDKGSMRSTHFLSILGHQSHQCLRPHWVKCIIHSTLTLSTLTQSLKRTQLISQPQVHSLQILKPPIVKHFSIFTLNHPRYQSLLNYLSKSQMQSLQLPILQRVRCTSLLINITLIPSSHKTPSLCYLMVSILKNHNQSLQPILKNSRSLLIHNPVILVYSHILNQELDTFHPYIALRFAHQDFLTAAHKLLSTNIITILFLLDLRVRVSFQCTQDFHSFLHLGIPVLVMAWNLLPFLVNQLNQLKHLWAHLQLLSLMINILMATLLHYLESYQCTLIWCLMIRNILSGRTKHKMRNLQITHKGYLHITLILPLNLQLQVVIQ
ncbi:uncharacterized protein LOC115375700 isoform X5 [Myripristis murdjan]|uniref:uncharacterized protein LOC115375700 isoform X5 n=1 Tax=Myripristis murdjan TaxID=586833 RepID=UPI0011761D99|nr:uncharacterized protein LOC115375700 isoform X5 [Myripristis murdjan]